MSLLLLSSALSRCHHGRRRFHLLYSASATTATASSSSSSSSSWKEVSPRHQDDYYYDQDDERGGRRRIRPNYRHRHGEEWGGGDRASFYYIDYYHDAIGCRRRDDRPYDDDDDDDDDDASSKNDATTARPPRRRRLLPCRRLFFSTEMATTTTNMTNTNTRRHYHATSRSEILPFVAAACVIGLSMSYAYRALDQMDVDVEEYEARLREYEGATTKKEKKKTSTGGIELLFAGGTLAIDVGTTRMKLSHRPTSTSTTTRGIGEGGGKAAPPPLPPPPPTVCVDREGKRSTPSMIWLPPPSSSMSSSMSMSDEMPLFGRHAETKFYDRVGGKIVRPLLSSSSAFGSEEEEEDVDVHDVVVGRAIRDVASNALDQALGGGEIGRGGGGGGGIDDDDDGWMDLPPLFVHPDDGTSSSSSSRVRLPAGSYDVRPIFTYPPISSIEGGKITPPPERYRRISAGMSYPEDIAAFVPEPLAVVVGAEYYGLLPPPIEVDAGGGGGGKGGGKKKMSSSVLVVDVGGTTTCISLVGADDDDDDDDDDEGRVTYSANLPLGGDTPIDLLVSHLAEDFFGPGHGAAAAAGGDDDDDDAEATTSSLTRPKLDDTAALQRLHEASAAAIHELSNKTRTEINVPYLTMDVATRRPRHMRSDISRNVVDAALEAWVGRALVPRLRRLDGERSVLSDSLPPPVDLSALYASAIARSLEVTSVTPASLRAVMVVGGGARMPLVRDSMARCVGYLAGEAYAAKRLIMPEGEMGDELAVLGAAVWGSRRGR